MIVEKHYLWAKYGHETNKVKRRIIVCASQIRPNKQQTRQMRI